MPSAAGFMKEQWKGALGKLGEPHNNQDKRGELSRDWKVRGTGGNPKVAEDLACA